MSDNEERQELELEALKAIYPELIDLRNEQKIKNHNRKTHRQQTWRPLEILITIKPNEENVYVQLDLVVRCSNKYPKEAPSFEFKNLVGIPNAIVQELERELIDLSKELASKDEEGLFMLISKVEECLTNYNKPAPKSFYDEMLSNQLKQQEKEEQLKLEMVMKEKQKEEELNKVIQEAMVEKQKLIENANKKRRRSYRENEISTLISSLESSISDLKEKYLSASQSLKDYQLNNQSSLRTCFVDHPLSDCKFKTFAGNELHVQRYSCDSHCDQYRTDYLAIQIKKDSSPFYFLTEWNVKLNQKSADKNQLKEDRSRIMKELLIIKTKFEHELVNLNHQNIFQPLAFTYSLENDLICLKYLQSHIDNIRFADLPFVFSKFQQEIKSTPFYFIQILEALNYLHLNKLVHGNLTTENVLIDLNTGHIKLMNTMVECCINDFIERSQSNAASKSNQFIEGKINFKLKDIESDYNQFAYLLTWFLLEFKINFKQLILIKQNDLIKLLHEQNNIDECTLELIKSCLNRSSITLIEPLLIEYFTSSLKKLNDSLNENIKKKNVVNLNDDLENDQFTANDNDNIKNLPLACKNSRLSDFLILSKLGQGGFGEVYKVKNKLDQNEYALKKIKMNTTNKLLNKKIKQEVRYLSGLCHENVVRYFSSWIEYEMIDKTDKIDEEEYTDEIDSSFSKSEKISEEKDSVYDSEDDDDSEDDEVDARILFSNSLCLPAKVQDEEISDDFIVFQDSHNDGDKNLKLEESDDQAKQNQISKVKKKFSTTQPSPYVEILYIQMELCEKSTLQHAIIAQSLYQDNRRSRRLFRELIEALSYIHEKDIIHRDLKPGNIFLDSFDHVKIGDFGLATGYVNDLIRVDNQATNQEAASTNQSSNQFNQFSQNQNQTLTMNQKSEIVGTPFYLSPEITAKSKDVSAKKITYTQKVDIYSCGIIMFEMFTKPPTTGMERFKILTSLRLPEIIFPDDVDLYLTEQEKQLAKLLLNHNPKERPTSSELLESEYLPPLEIEEAKQQIMIKQIIQNSRSKQHKYLLNTLFNKPMSSVEDIVYDSEIDLVKSKKLINNEHLRLKVFQFVSDRLRVILKKYGAYRFSAPTFTPANSLNKFNLNHAFNIMDNNGCIIVPPYDLRIPFARYIARSQNFNVPTFKRYAIEKVFRSRIIGYHPRELYEFAFDIVTQQTGSNHQVLPDVEVLLVLNDIIDSFESLKNKPFTLRVNSVKFLKAVFSYLEIDEKHHEHVLRILAESNDRNFVSKSNDSEFSKTPKDHINYMLSSKNILEPSKINILIQMLFDNEKYTAKEMIELIQFLMRRKLQPKQKQAYDNAIDAMRELGLIIDCLQSSPCAIRMKIKFVPNLVLNLSNCNIYSKLIFQLQYDVVRKHQILHQVLATGGRYDDLIQDFSVNFSSKTDPINERALVLSDQKTACGFSLEIDKIIKCIIEDDEQVDLEETNDCDLVLYADVYDDDKFRVTFKDLCQIATELRQNGYQVKIFNEKLIKSLSDLYRYCSDNQVKYLFILIKSNDLQSKKPYQLKQITFDKEKYSDRKLNGNFKCVEIIDHIKYELNSNQNYSSSPFNLNSQFNQINSNFTFESTSCSISSNYLSSTTSFASNVCNINLPNSKNTNQFVDCLPKINSSTNIQFISIEKTFESVSKKKVYQLINTSIANKLNYLINSSIEVLALELPFKILKLIVYESDFEKDSFGNISDKTCEENIKRTVEKCPKYKNQIKELMYIILDLKRKRESLIILTSLNDLHDFKFVIVP